MYDKPGSLPHLQNQIYFSIFTISNEYITPIINIDITIDIQI